MSQENLTEVFNLTLEAITQSRLDQKYLDEKLQPLLLKKDLAYYIDNLGESLLFYAITYKNQLLLDHLLDKTDYASFPAKRRKKLMNSVFRGIKQLSYDCQDNYDFLEETVQHIANSSYCPILEDFIKEGYKEDYKKGYKEGYFAYLFQRVLPRDKKSAEFMGKVMKILKEHDLLGDQDEPSSKLKEVYELSAKSCLWARFNVRNFEKDPNFFNLQYLKYEFFHHAAERGLYNQIEAVNLTKNPDILFKQNSSGESVFLILFRKAPFQFLKRHLKNIGQCLESTKFSYNQTNNRGQTFLHLLILNKEMSLEEKIEILQSLGSNYNIEKIADKWDCNSLIPLALFIKKFGKEVQKNYSRFIDVFALLASKPSTPTVTTSDRLVEVQSVVTFYRLALKVPKKTIKDIKNDDDKYLTEEQPRKNDDMHDLKIDNHYQKLTKICLDLKLEKLLIDLLEKYPYLDLNSVYFDSVGTEEHLICIAARNNCKEVLRWFLKQKASKEVSFISINEEEILQKSLRQRELKNLLVDQSLINEYTHYSIFDKILDFANGPFFNTVEEESKVLLFDIFEKMWSNVTQDQKTRCLLNLSFTNRGQNASKKDLVLKEEPKLKPKFKKLSLLVWPNFLISKLYKLNNAKLLTLLKADISKLKQENLPEAIKKSLLFCALESNLGAFFKDQDLIPLITVNNLEPDTDIQSLCHLLCRVPEVIFNITNLYPQVRKFFFSKNFLQTLEAARLNKKEEINFAKTFASGAIDMVLNRKSLKDELDENDFRGLFARAYRFHTLHALSTELIRIIVQKRKVKEVYDKLELIGKPEDRVFLIMCCKFYIQSEMDDEKFENELTTMYLDPPEPSEDQVPRAWATTPMLIVKDLSQLKKVTRLNLNSWGMPILNIEEIFQKVKKEQIKKPEILYIPYYIRQNNVYLKSYAVEVCKAGGKEVEIVKAVYKDISTDYIDPDEGAAPKKYSKPEFILLDHAIRTADVKGVTSVLDANIYEGNSNLSQFQSPFYAVLELVQVQKKPFGAELLDKLNKIVNKLLTYFPPELIEIFLMPPIRETMKSVRGSAANNYCLLYQRNLIKYLTDENFKLLPFKTILACDLLVSLEGTVYSAAQFYIKALYERKPETIKAILSQLFEQERSPNTDYPILKFIHMLLSKEKLPNLIFVIQNVYKLEYKSVQPINACLRQCLRQSKDLIEPLVKVLLEQEIKIYNNELLKEFKGKDIKSYHTLMLSNDLEEETEPLKILRVQKVLLEVKLNDLNSILKLFKDSRKKDLAIIFSDPEIGKVLGINGLFTKIKTFLELAEQLVKDKLLAKEKLLDWTMAAFEGSCELQSLLTADKVVASKKSSQFNLFELKHVLNLKDQAISIHTQPEPREPIGNSYQLVRIGSQAAQQFNEKVKKSGFIIGPYTEREIQAKFALRKPKFNMSDTGDSGSVPPQVIENKHNIYGFEPRKYSSQSQDSSRAPRTLNKKVRGLSQRKEFMESLGKYEKENPNPVPLRCLFTPYQKNWSFSNESDDRDAVKAMILTLDYLESLMSAKDLDKNTLTTKFREALILAIKSNMTVVEKRLGKYLETLATQKDYSSFYLKAMIAFFERRTAFITYRRISKEKIHSVYQKETDQILPLFSHLKTINKKDKLQPGQGKNLLGDLIREIYFYNNPKVSQAFCQALYEASPKDELEKGFNIPKVAVLKLFLGLAVRSKNLTNFSALLSLDPSVKQISKIMKLDQSNWDIEADFSAQNEIAEENILQVLFKKGMPKFIADYVKVQKKDPILDSMESDQWSRYIILSEIENPTWLHIALVKGMTGLVKDYLPKANLSNKDVECALVSGKFDLLELVLKKVFRDDVKKIFTYIRDNQILLKALRTSKEGFILSIWKAYVSSDSSKPQHGLVLQKNHFLEKDDEGMTIFNYVAFRRMPYVFYTMIGYIKKVICNSNNKEFVDFMQQVLNQAPALKKKQTGNFGDEEGDMGDEEEQMEGDHEEEEFEDEDGEEEEEEEEDEGEQTGKRSKKLKKYKKSKSSINNAKASGALSPLQYALRTRFYELLCFAIEFNIPIDNKKPENARSIQTNLKYSLTEMSTDEQLNQKIEALTKEKQNEFSGLYCESLVAFLKTVKLIQNASFINVKTLPKGWIDLLERLYFINHTPVISQQDDWPFEINFKDLATLGLDMIFIRLYPEVIPIMLSKSKIKETSPSVIIYFIDKALKGGSQSKNPYLDNIFKTYVKETLKNSEKNATNVQKLEQLFNKDLGDSIQKIRKILNLEEKENKVVKTLEDFILPHRTIDALATRYHAQGHLFALKALILRYPLRFFAFPPDHEYSMQDEEEITDYTVWTHFVDNPSFICSVLSLLDSKTFTSLITNGFERLLFVYQEENEEQVGHKTRSLAWCMLYITLSLRENGVLPKEYPETFRNIIAPLVKGGSLTAVIPLIRNFLNFVSSETLTYQKIKNIEAHRPVLLGICVELRKLLKDSMTLRLNYHTEISDQETDKNLGKCIDFVIKELSATENPLIIYSNTIMIALEFFQLIERVATWARKFNIIIKLSFNECMQQPELIGVKTQKPGATEELLMTIWYSAHYDKEQKICLINWEQRSWQEIEDDLEALFILRDIKKSINKKFKAKHGDDVNLPRFDFDSLEAAPYQEKLRFINSELALQDGYENYFGILPFLNELRSCLEKDSTERLFKLNESDENYPPLLLKNSDNKKQHGVLHEFYVPFCPDFKDAVIHYIDPHALQQKKKKLQSLSRLLEFLTQYEKKVAQLSTLEDLTKLPSESLDWFISSDALSSYHEVPYYEVLKMRSIIQNFQTRLNVFPQMDISVFKWKMSTRSFLEEIVSNLIKSIRNCMEQKLKDSDIHPRKKKVLESYLGREDDVFATAEKYLNNSVLRKLINLISQAFIVELPYAARTFSGFYFVFEKVAPKKVREPEDNKYFHLFDRIICFSHVNFEVVGKLVLIKIQYFVNEPTIAELEEYTKVESNTKNVLVNNKPITSYLMTIFNKYDIYHQLMPARGLVDNFLDKKLIEDSLIALSKKISGETKKQINFSINYHKIYQLFEPLVQKAISSGTPRLESESIFAQAQAKLLAIKKFMIEQLPSKIEKMFFSPEIMDYLAVKVQLQNQLYRTKKPLLEYLQEETFTCNTYPQQLADAVILQDLSLIKGKREQKLEKFVFLIQTNRELTLRGALTNQDYLILYPDKVEIFKVSSGKPLPDDKTAHYLLISPTWPNLEYCSDQVERVLILDGRNRIIDVTRSCLKDVLQDIQTDDSEKFKNQVHPFLVNKGFSIDTDLSVTNLFPLYPSLITLQLSGLNPVPKPGDLAEPPMPKLKSFQSGTGSQLFDEQKILEMFFIADSKLDMNPFVPEDLKYSQKLKADSDFQRLISEFQSQIMKFMRSSGIKELVDKEKIKLPDIVIEMEMGLEYTLRVPLKQFNEKLKNLLDDIGSVLYQFFTPGAIEAHNIQDAAGLLYEDVFLETDFLAFRNVLSLSKGLANFHLQFSSKLNQKAIMFVPNKKGLEISIQLIEGETKCEMNFPPKEEIQQVLRKVLLEQQFKRTHDLLASKTIPSGNEARFLDILSHIKQAIAPHVDVVFDFDIQQVQNETQVRLLLSWIDILLWNLAEGAQLCSIANPKVFQNLQKLEVRITNDKSIRMVDILKAKLGNGTLVLSFNIASGGSFVLIPSYSQIYFSLCEQLLPKDSYNSQLASFILSADDLTFSCEGNKSVQKKIRVDKSYLSAQVGVKDIDEVPDLNIHISAVLLGIRNLKVYPCEGVEIIDLEDQAEPHIRTLNVSLPNAMTEQNYFLCLLVNGKLFGKPVLINIFKPNSKVFKIAADIMEAQNRLKGKTEVITRTSEPFYLIAEQQKSSLEAVSRQRSLVQHLKFYSETKTSIKKIADLEKDEETHETHVRPPPNFCSVRSKVLDETKIFYRIVVPSSSTIRVKPFDIYTLRFCTCQNDEQVDLKFVASLDVDLSNTVVTAPNNTLYKGQAEKEPIKPSKDIASLAYRMIYENLGSVPSISLETRASIEDKDFITEKDVEKPIVKKLFEGNYLQNIPGDQYTCTTGEERIESLQFKNKDGDEALVTEADVRSMSAIFIHNQTKAKFLGEVFMKENKCFVKWRPFIKGSYSLYLNRYLVKCANNLLVLAGQIELTKCTFKWPQLTSQAYYDPIYFELGLRDKYGNKLNHIEITKFYVSLQKILEFDVSLKDVTVKPSFGTNSETGIQYCQASLVPKSDSQSSEEGIDASVVFLLNKVEIHRLNIKMKGISFTKKLELFRNDISNKGSSHEIQVNRKFFFKDLMEYSLEKFKSISRVAFLNEPGIDAGGVRREFWEMVGKEFKNSKFQVFAEFHDKYFLSYKYTLNANTEKALKLYGALIAGSISNKELIGVNFANCFTKVLFGHDVELEDLKEIFGEQVYSNYNSLKSMRQEDLDALEQYFVVNIEDKQYELVQGGAEVKVTKNNVKEFLDRLALFYLKTYHEKAFQLIIEGFSAIFPLEKLTKWFGYSDFPHLTYGSLNVTGTNILQFVSYSGDKIDTLKQFFAQFLMEADTELLQNFLKFTTGSSALPYGDSNYKVYVGFYNRSETSLPISHTCSKSIEVPKYRSYAHMKKMLTAAFLYGSEGFAFG